MSANKETMRIVKNVTCTACGCTCDDLRLQVNGPSEIVELEPACPLAEKWFLQPPSQQMVSCRIDGKPVPWEQGCRRAAEILSCAHAPLLFGLEHTTCEAQRLAVAIADRIGAAIDPTTDTCESASHRAIQIVGSPTATLGEVATRSDLVLYWFADPKTTHPRHLDRYVRPSDREVMVVDQSKSATADLADLFLQTDAHAGFEALGILRALVANVLLDAAQVQRSTGVELSRWQALAGQLRTAQYGAFFYDSSLVSTAEVEALLELARDLNQHTRCVALNLGRAGNAVGAQQVLTWQTGFPAAVDFSHGFPRYLPREASAASLLARDEVDAALAVGCDPWLHLAKPASDCLDSIPLVAIDSRETETTRQATVAFHVARDGIESGGSVYRSDGVPLPLRPVLQSPHPTTEAVLQLIGQRIEVIEGVRV